MSYEKILTDIALNDERFMVMTAENRALIRNLPPILGKRFIDTGITEQTMIGAAAGLALRGRIPVVHALTSFLTMRAFEFIRTDIGLPGLPVKLSGFIPGFLSDANGPTHQAIEDISLMRGIPNIEVLAPADEDDLIRMLPVAWRSPHPTYIRINNRKTIYTHAPFIAGKAEVMSEGKDITLLTYGFMFEQCMVAAEILTAEGRHTGVINMRTLKPVDEAAIIQAARNSRTLVTVEDHLLTGGLYSIVAETLLKYEITAKVIPFALEERWFRPAMLQDVLSHEGFTGKQIAESLLGHTTPYRNKQVTANAFEE